MITRIETTAEKWESEYLTMSSQGFHICTRDNKIFWECEE